MGESERIHAVPRRGAVEYYRETACPACGAVVFIQEDDPSRIFDELQAFGVHQCGKRPLVETVAPSPGRRPPKAQRTVPEPGAVERYPVDLGRILPETAREFRAAIEAAHGKPLRRFSGAMRRPGLPIHFVKDWEPALGFVRSFAKSDVHRPLDPALGVFRMTIPYLKVHFERMTGTRHHKYYYSAKGVAKSERSRTLRVVAWKWPARY